MASYADSFRDSLNTYSGPQPEEPNLLEKAGDVLSGGWDFVMGRRADANLVGGAAQRDFVNSITPTGVIKDGKIQTRLGLGSALERPEVVRAGARIGVDTENLSSSSVIGGLGATAIAPLIALEIGYRGLNTVVGGAVLAGADFTPVGAGARILSGNDYMNPLFRDGASWSDVPDTFKMVWGQEEAIIGPDGVPLKDDEGNELTELNAITAGQAISSVIGVTALNLYDTVNSANVREELDKSIEENSLLALQDKENERGLLDWTWGLHTEFRIDALKERESAFNQGVGRWISGTADAAVLWWLAPEVIGLQGLGVASRSLFVRSIGDLSDIKKLNASLASHSAALRGEAGGQKTAVGRLVESLARLNTEQIARHRFATSSTDAPLIARTFGPAKTFDEVAERLQALAGDRVAIARLFEKDAVIADAMSLNIETIARANRDITTYENSIKGLESGSLLQKQQAKNLQRRIDLINVEADQASKVLDASLKENAQLAAAMAGISREAGLPNALRLGEIQISKLPVGPLSAARLEKQALKAVKKQNGTNLFKVNSFKTGGAFGRTVRVWSATTDYLSTSRMKGLVNLNDSNDVIAELDSVIQTLPMMRRLMKQFQGDTFLPGTTQLVSDFRQEIYQRMNNAVNPTERMVVFQDFERRMWNALASEYNLAPEQAQQLLQSYSGMRKAVVEQVKAKGLITQDGEIHVLKDMQSLLAENLPTIDFHLIEAIFRLERGSGITQLKSWSDIKGSRFAAGFDSLWRPLVLMRLGYTTRNVLEGNLRELAMFKSMGIVTERGMGTQALEGAFAFRAAQGLGRGLDRAGRRVAFGSLKSRRMAVLEQQTIATAAKKQADEVQENLDTTAGEITQRYEEIEKRVREIMSEEFQAATSNRVSVTMERVETETLGEMTRLADEADELIIPVRYVRPLFSGRSGKRSNYVAGFDTPQEGQVRAVMQDATAIGEVKNPKLQGEMADASPNSLSSLDNIAGGTGPIDVVEANIRNWLSVKERSQWDELINRYNSQSFGDAELGMYETLVGKASRRATYDGMRKGDVVVRTIDPKTGTYEIVHDYKNITLDDVNDDLLGIIKAEQLDNIEYVRANVFGSSMDLRPSQIELPTSASTPAGARTANGSYGPMLTDVGEEYLGNLGELFGIPRSRMLGELRPNDLGKNTNASLDKLESLLNLAEGNPELASALRLKFLINSAPKHMRDWFESSGVLITNKEIKRLEKLSKKQQAATVNNKARREADLAKFKEDIKLRYRADENAEALTAEEFDALLPSISGDLEKLVFHGGKKVPGDVLFEEPPMTMANLENLVGMGFYTTRDPGIGVSYIFNRADKTTGENVLYTAVLPPNGEKRFLDMYEPMQVVEGTTTPEQLMQNEDDLRDIFFNMLSKNQDQGADDGLDIEGDFEDLWAQVEKIVDDNYVDATNPIRDKPRTTPVMMEDYRQAMLQYFETEYKDAMVFDITQDEGIELAYNAQMLWVETITDQGGLGIRHLGGQNVGGRDHDVFVWYVVPEVKPVDEITADFLALETLKKRAETLASEESATATATLSKYNDIKMYANRSGNSLDAAMMSDKAKSILAAYMREHGVGRVILDDSLSPSGKTVISSPEMIAVSTDQAEAAIPGGIVGKDFVDNTLPQLQQEAMVRNPAAFNAGQVEDDMLLPLFDNDPEILKIIRGQAEGTPEQKAKLARGLEFNGYSHIQIGAADSSKFLSSAELVGSRKNGMAYGAMLAEPEIAQTRNMLLQNDDKFQSLLREYQSQASEVTAARAKLESEIELAKKRVAQFDRRAGKRTSGDPVKGGLGSGQETFRGKGYEYTTLGPRNVNSQGSMYSEMSSSSTTNLANLYGYTDYAMMKLRKSAEIVNYTPGSNYYFNVMSEQLNKFFRNDLVARGIFKGETDDEILTGLMTTEIGRKYVRDVHAFGDLRGLVDDTQLTADARDEMIELIAQRRSNLTEMVKDEDILTYLDQNEVTPDFLMSRLGWRADLASFPDALLVQSEAGILRNITSKIMHTIGTLPEDALVRHPFFRARWREEMQRQSDLYASQGVTSFSEVQINAMDRVAKKFAVKQVNETLYTIQRISTPAHIFKFVIPFFPAFASALKFWMLQVPARNPEAVARYAMAYNAPESAGWVYDEDGQKVDGPSNFREAVTNKLFGGAEGSIVIQFTNNKARDALAKVTGGMTRLEIPQGSLDFMLQGANPFIPGLHPWLVVPSTWLAAQMPDVSTSVETGNLQALPYVGEFIPDEVNAMLKEKNVTKSFYKAAVPFGIPTAEKDLVDVVAQTFTPAGLDRIITATMRKMDSDQYNNAAKEIHRTAMTNWDLGGRVGPEPKFLDAVDNTNTFWWFRAAMSMTLPVSVQAKSPYQFYINESRRIDRETYDAGGTYNEAGLKFLEMYGEPFFRYRQSLSGSSSGMGSNVGEFDEYNRDPKLMADLANIGDDASYITMATRPFAEAMNENGYDPAVRAWQMGRRIEGTSDKFLRGGESTPIPEVRSDVELGWIKYDKMVQMLDTLAAEAGTTVSESAQFAATKQQMIAQIGAEHGSWFEDYQDPSTNRWVKSNYALEAMFDSGYFDAHKNDPKVGPYANAMLNFREYRRGFMQVLLARKAEGGSGNIDAKKNADVAAAYATVIEELKASDPTGNFTNTWERFFQSDPLEPVPELEMANGR